MSTKNAMLRAAAGAAATVLMTVGAAGTALASHDNGNGNSQDHASHAAPAAQANQGNQGNQGKSEAAKGDKGDKGDKGTKRANGDKADKGSKGAKGDKGGKAPQAGQADNRGQGDTRGNGHTPVTVCHLLGNGSYNILTFDDNALEAHVNHGDLYPVPADGCPAAESGSDEAATQGHGHTPVTVCHVLGNGSYNILTFDDNALEAHVNHGDLYPVPAEGCPTEAVVTDETATTTTGTTSTGTTSTGTVLGTEGSTVETEIVRDTVVAGVEAIAPQPTTVQPGEGQVLGVEQFAGAGRAPAVTGPLAGVLPQTGAGQLTMALVGGLGLLAAGAALVARRRAQGAL